MLNFYEIIIKLIYCLNISAYVYLAGLFQFIVALFFIQVIYFKFSEQDVFLYYHHQWRSSYCSSFSPVNLMIKILQLKETQTVLVYYVSI